MTPKLNEFESYEPCYTNKNVQILDGTLLRMVGLGSIQIPPTRLHTRLTKMDECKIIFDDIDIFCVIRFKDGGLDLLKFSINISHNTNS